LAGVLAFRPESSLLYLNAEYVQTQVLMRLGLVDPQGLRCVICDLSASPTMDLAGARMLAELFATLHDRGIRLMVVNAHGRLRDLLRAEGLGEKIPGITRGTTIDDALGFLADEARQTSRSTAV
jgi:SulP family sulfate permease